MKINLEKLSLDQKNNFNQAIKAYEEKNTISSEHPPVLYVELTQNCISKCDFCKPNWNNNPKFNMSEELFQEILNNYIKYASLVDLRGWGESLILPNFKSRIEQVSELGANIRMATTLGCGSKDTLNSLIDNDVFLSISLDAIDKKLYESIRPGINFDTVIKNIKYVTKKLEKKGTLENNIRLSMTMHRDNLYEAEKILDLAKDVGITQLRIVPVQSYPTNPILLKNFKELTINTLNNLSDNADKKKINLQLGFSPFEEFIVKDKTYNPCCHPWMYTFINYTGDILPCEHMLGNSDINISIGNISKTKNWWNGHLMKEFRKKHTIKILEELPGKCKKCYTLGRYADHEQDIYKKFEKWNFNSNDIKKITKKYI
ncbi:MAG: radical SAM protein [archaeon]